METPAGWERENPVHPATFKTLRLSRDRGTPCSCRLLQIDVVGLLIRFLIFILLVHVLDHMFENQ